MLDIKDDERFERQGDDLIFDLPLSFSQAALGGEVTVPTPYGEEEVRIPPGTQPETVLRLRGRGPARAGTERARATCSSGCTSGRPSG